jgi:putative transcriptional regulator
MARKKYRSDALAALHETAAGLHRIGLMPATTMREFDVLCLTPAKELSTKEFSKLKPIPTFKTEA